MEQVLKKQGERFKVHNTWDLIGKWDNGGMELFLDKVLKNVKSFLKQGTDLGRITRSYIETIDDSTWFCYQTKGQIIMVSVSKCGNLNGGTWVEINEIKFV